MTVNPLLDTNARVVIAHRGNRVGAPENTIEALRQAVQMGADAIEFDVRMTRDGVPVVLHDATVDRTTNGTGALNTFTFDEARALDAAASAPIARAEVHRVPSLEEVLDTFPTTPLVVEVKELAAAESTERLIRRFGAETRVLIGSANSSVMDWFYRTGLACCASMRDASFLIPLALAGLRPLKPFYDVLSLTMRFHGLPVPVRQMASVARKVGVPTQVWTVNDPAQAKRLWLSGVSGVVTDDPSAMLRARSEGIGDAAG